MTTEYDPTATTSRHYGYSIAGELVASVGERVFGLEASEPQKDYWNALFSSVIYLDDILDGPAPKDQRLEEFQRALGVVRTGELDPNLNKPGQELLLNLHEATINLDPERLEQITKQAHTIALLGERARVAQDAHSLGLIALAEGRMTARLISVSKNASNIDPSDFNGFLELGGAYANIFDSLVDLRKDRSEGLIAFEPTRADRREMMSMFAPGGFASLKKMNPSSLLFLATQVVKVERTKNSEK